MPCRSTFTAVLLVLAASRLALAQADVPTVFVANNVSDEITTFTIDSLGGLTFIENAPSSDGPQAIALSPDGRHLAVPHGTANEVSEALIVYRVEGDSTLTPLLSTLVPDSPLAVLWVRDHVLAVTLTDVGGANFVRLHDWDAEAETLTFTQAVPTGTFTTSLAMTPDGSVLFSQDSLGNKVNWHQLDEQGQIVGGAFLATGSIYPLELAVSRNGASLYACGGISQGGHNVQGFAIEGSRNLAPLPGSPFQSPGNSPSNVAVSADDTLMFVGHGTDATVRSFLRAADGTLTATAFSFDVGLQGTIGDVQVMGSFLLVTDESTAIDGITGLYVFEIHADGSFTQVGAIASTDGVRPESITTWQPPLEITGDYNGDGVVDVEDLVLVILEWGAGPGSPADGNGDGVVNVEDLVLVVVNWT